MTNAFTEKKLKEFDEKFLGNNTRGIVTFEEGLGGVNYHKAICNNCGKTFKGNEADKMIFGHIGCPKPNGQYIKNDTSPEKLKSFLQSAIVEARKDERERIGKLLEPVIDDLSKTGDVMIKHNLSNSGREMHENVGYIKSIFMRKDNL